MLRIPLQAFENGNIPGVHYKLYLCQKAEYPGSDVFSTKQIEIPIAESNRYSFSCKKASQSKLLFLFRFDRLDQHFKLIRLAKPCQ